jgi:hypothetical protein
VLWHLVEWAGMALAAGVAAGLTLAAIASVGVWRLYRRLRRRVQALTGTPAGYALQTAAAVAGRGKLPPQVVHALRRRLGGRPEVW